MNRGEFQTSLVQPMIWSGSASGSNSTSSANITSSLKPCHEEDQEASPNLPSLSSPSVLFSQQFPHTSSSGLVHMNGALPSLPDGIGSENHMPESWNQLLL
jgi:hypothetical protein